MSGPPLIAVCTPIYYSKQLCNIGVIILDVILKPPFSKYNLFTYAVLSPAIPRSDSRIDCKKYIKNAKDSRHKASILVS